MKPCHRTPPNNKLASHREIPDPPPTAVKCPVNTATPHDPWSRRRHPRLKNHLFYTQNPNLHAQTPRARDAYTAEFAMPCSDPKYPKSRDPDPRRPPRTDLTLSTPHFTPQNLRTTKCIHLFVLSLAPEAQTLQHTSKTSNNHHKRTTLRYSAHGCHRCEKSHRT